MPADQLNKAVLAAKAGRWDDLEGLIDHVVDVDKIPTGKSYNILHQVVIVAENGHCRRKQQPRTTTATTLCK
eukprot:m.366086 g.366086  ORF g.366086 m.366086 type:complete len:72 (-) comp19974_c1_seq17:1182-1397(-)